jgi:electron transfer flavoprotein beta subunit
MHILVTLKHVHDPNTPVDFMSVAGGKELSLHSATAFALNAYDANAIEAAVALKEETGAKVTAISIGGVENAAHLRRAIAMGADAGVLVKASAGLNSDPMTTGKIIAAASERLEPVDLVLCGRQASDTDGGQTLFYLAEAMGMTAVSPVVGLEDAGDGVVGVERLADGGVQRLGVTLPAVLGLSNEINRPRAPGLKGVMMSKKASISEWTLEDLGCEGLEALVERVSLAVVKRTAMEPEFLTAGSGSELGRTLAERLKSEGFF